MSQTVWVVETYLGCNMPRVMEYSAVRVSTDSFTIAGPGVPGRYGGRRKTVIRKAVGRWFFTDKARLIDYCRRWLKSEYERHYSTCLMLQTHLDKDDLDLEILKHGSAVGRKERK
jgi:hypothetical protein